MCRERSNPWPSKPLLAKKNRHCMIVAPKKASEHLLSPQLGKPAYPMTYRSLIGASVSQLSIANANMASCTLEMLRDSCFLLKQSEDCVPATNAGG